VDVVLDTIGGDYMQKNLKLLKRGGRLVQLAFLQGAKAELNMATLLFNNLRWQGVTLRSQSREMKANLTRQILASCTKWLESGALNVPIHAQFPLQEAQKAHAMMEQNLNSGKIVLKVATL
jgi:NADPH:quinone reductase-like Zn-dependent oxidoreductase